MNKLQVLISGIVYALCFQYEQQTKYRLKDKNNVYHFVFKQLEQSPAHIKLVIIISTWILYLVSFFKLRGNLLKSSASDRSYFITKQRSSILMPIQKCIQFYDSLVIIRFMQLIQSEKQV